jgi:hypothetical protein
MEEPQAEKVDRHPLVVHTYGKMPRVRVTFRTEGVGIANASKYEFFFEAGQKLLAFKVKMS